MTAAIVPVKHLSRVKQRLSGLLSRSERRRLCIAMLFDVLDCLEKCSEVEAVFVVTPDADICKMLDSHYRKAAPLLEDKQSTLNRALKFAVECIDGKPISELVILPGDVPLVSSDELDNLIIRARGTSVTIVPDRAEKGTNFLMLSPPSAIEPNFGPGSFREHIMLAERKGQTRTVLNSFRLSCDIDRPADLEILLQHGKETKSCQILKNFSIENRLVSS